MRLRLASALIALVPMLSLACSGEDDGPGGGGSGIGTGAAAGQAGSSGLQVGGRAGQAGKAGSSGAAGQSSGNGGVGGAGGAAGAAGGVAGGAGSGGSAGESAGQAGQAGSAGQAGTSGEGGAAGSQAGGGEAGGGQAGGGQAGGADGPQGYACDGAKRDPGELCDGDAAPLGVCSDYVEGSGGSKPVVTCDRCLADTSQCVRSRNGRQDGDETDVDCGGLVNPDCGLGFSCLEDSDCDSQAGLRCVVGTCGAVSIDLLGTIDAPAGSKITSGLSVRSRLPLPDDTAIEFVLDPIVDAGLSATVDVVGEPSTGPHGRAGLLKVAFVGTAQAPGTVSGKAVLKRGASITELSFSTSVVPRPPRPNVFPAPTFYLNDCSVGGPLLDDDDGVYDVPLGATICASFDTNAGALGSAKLGGVVGTLADAFYQATFVMPSSAPLFEGLPAVLPLEIVASYDAGWVSFGTKVRLTAKTFASNGSPNALGTPGKPLLATEEALLSPLDGVDHYQLRDAVSFASSAQLRRRIEGYDGAAIDLGEPNVTVTLGLGARLENVVLHGNPGSTGAPCLAVQSEGSAALLRDVEIKGCTTALDGRSEVDVVRSYFHDNGVGLVLGDASALGTFPLRMHVLDTRIETGSVGVRVEKATAALRKVAFFDQGLGVDASTEANVSIVRGSFTAGANAVRTGDVSSVVVADTVIDGKNANGGLGLQVGGATPLGPLPPAIGLRNVRFRDLPAGAVVMKGPSNVEIAWSKVENSGGATPPNGGESAPAIDSQAGELSLVGTVIAGSKDVGVLVGGNPTASTFGAVSFFAGSAVEGGQRGIVTALDGRLTLARAVLRGTSGPALTLGSTAAFSLSLVSLVDQRPRSASAPLLLVERPGGVVTGDTLDRLLVQAGFGAERVSNGAGATCTGVEDVVGGTYVVVKAGSTFCF